ncbi:hypothetical protein N7507_005079 [Penicillium longicatenatum]|nr:hypothetical protein N7507_005079 [Penicillium longicatenatum]
MSQVSDLVKDAKLSTKLDSEYTTHTFLESSLVAGKRPRRRQREEKWKRVRHLGIGIFGTVWLEECVVDNSNKLRAVKEIRKIAPGLQSMDYGHELEAITKFSQQRFDGCFVKSSGWFDNDESVFICMEYFPLGNFQKHISRPFPEGETQLITLQLLEGLDFMHSNGFAHRDLKPQNIFVLSPGPEWWVKIGDFGTSKRVMEVLAGVQTFNGAPAFTAPEVYTAMWEPVADRRTASSNYNSEADIWSLGAVTYYLLTGNLPFMGQRELLSYYKKESDLPSKPLETVEASCFLRELLAPTPSDRLTAKDALEHAWLICLHQELEPDEPVAPPPPTEKDARPSQSPGTQITQGVMLSGTVNLTAAAPTMLGPETPLTLPSQASLGMDGDTYKHFVNEAARSASNNMSPLSHIHPLHRPAADTILITHSQHGDLLIEPPIRSHNPRQNSQPSSDFSLAETGVDTLPPYTRRRSDAAPIPLADLNYTTPRAQSPVESQGSTISSPRGSLDRHSSDSRLSERIRRVSGSMLPKRHQRREHGKNIDVPASQTSNQTKGSSNTSKTKSQIVQIPGRPQFAEDLPLFPMRSKKV